MITTHLSPVDVAWGDVATWTAAVATFVAVWVALTSSRREHERTIKLRDEEWASQKLTTRNKTARLAITFHKELLRAALVLMGTANAVRTALSAGDIHGAAELLGRGFAFEGLPLMTRFADQLEGFEDVDAIAILNAISIWRGMYVSMPASVAAAPPNILHQVALERVVAYDGAIKLFKELQESLERYFSHVPELKLRSFEEAERQP